MMIDFIYLFKKFNIKTTGILHVGSNTGQERDVYEILGIPKVIWIEAIPFIFNQLKQYVSHLPHHVCVNACIGDVDGKDVVFNVSNNEAQSSSYLELGVHKEIHPTVHYIEQIKMKTIRLDTLNKKLNLGINDYDFLNFDVQGVELNCLKSLGKLLKNFKYCYLEVNKKPTYIGGALIEEIDAYLSKYGFYRAETGSWVADTWTDALYLKS